MTHRVAMPTSDLTYQNAPDLEGFHGTHFFPRRKLLIVLIININLYIHYVQSPRLSLWWIHAVVSKILFQRVNETCIPGSAKTRFIMPAEFQLVSPNCSLLKCDNSLSKTLEIFRYIREQLYVVAKKYIVTTDFNFFLFCSFTLPPRYSLAEGQLEC